MIKKIFNYYYTIDDSGSITNINNLFDNNHKLIGKCSHKNTINLYQKNQITLDLINESSIVLELEYQYTSNSKQFISNIPIKLNFLYGTGDFSNKNFRRGELYPLGDEKTILVTILFE